jgi:dTDP-4-amino-4,6-dideoxygalactose transaminase/predicted dehydrogenase
LKLVCEALRSQNLYAIDGQQVRAFERAFAAAHDVPYAVASTSGTAAIHVALGALDLNPGAEVITTPVTDLGTIIPIIQQNLIPVFADVDESFNLDPRDVARKITPRTRAIIAVHLFGNPCDMDALRSIAAANDLALIEDCSQAHFAEYHGRRVGTFGHIACFSFQQSKLMTTGDGGMTITSNRAYAERMKLFVDKGWARKGFGPRAYLFHAPNYRMTELAGAVGLAQLAKLPAVVARRRELAALMNQNLSGLEGIAPVPITPGGSSSYWTYPVIVAGGNAPALAEQLRTRKVWASGGYIGKPIYLCSESLSAKKTFGTSQWPFTCNEPDVTYEYKPGLCRQAEERLDSLLTIPIDESWTAERIHTTSEILAQCVRARGAMSCTVPAPTLPPPRELPTAGSVPRRRIRVAIIGCGQMGRWHLDAYRRNPAVDVVAFADTSLPSAARFATETGGRAYASHRELLALERVDAASVCVVPASHRAIVLDALAAGVHVLCEKPLATSLDEARSMAAAADARGLHVLTAFKFRFFDEVQQAKQLLGRGALGRIISARLMFGCDLDMTGKWYAVPQLAGGGIVMDNGPHAFDLIEFLLGRITSLSATAGNCRPLDVEDCATIFCRLRNAASVVIDLSWSMAAAPTSDLEIYGDQGSAQLDVSGISYKLASWSDWKRIQNTVEGKRAFARQVDHFVDAACGTASPALEPEAGVRAQQLIEAAYRSINSGGRTISVDGGNDFVPVSIPAAAGAR